MKFYFSVTHNELIGYTSILDLQKEIFEYFGLNYIEGICNSDESRLIDSLGGNLRYELPVNKVHKKKDPKHYLFRYFELTLWRWYMATFPELNDEDIITIWDADMLHVRPDLLMNKLIEDIELDPSKVLVCYGYTDNPKGRYMAYCQTFKVKVIRHLFNDILKVSSMEEMVLNAEQVATINMTEEQWMSKLYTKYDLCRFINYYTSYPNLCRYIPIQSVMYEGVTELPEDYVAVHGHPNDITWMDYQVKLKHLINSYYLKHGIRFKV